MRSASDSGVAGWIVRIGSGGILQVLDEERRDVGRVEREARR